MALEVLLMDAVPGLGIEGDVVRVADGYARNYLFPKGKASAVTEGKKRQIEKKRMERLELMRKEKTAAEELAKKFENISCTIAVKTAESGKMFGSVGSAQIIEKIAEHGIHLERNQIKLDGPFHELGVFDVPIDLHPEVKAIVKVWIVEE
ncbi:MAG: large subunit ribosomal protein [Verrucomicrobiota bacterium]|jgi:large subunit ribosomal protein L9|nr:large subunit ribosomal protein [Verrucomicrobiota bacterium]MDK2963087.1 large subunit ribosomal protein [Verrucomicrobiota bacterium]